MSRRLGKSERTPGNLVSAPSIPPPWSRPDGVSAEALPGTVTRAFGKFFHVRLRDQPRTLLCTVRGSLRRERLRTDLVAVGDRVWLVDVGEGEGSIEAVEPRQRVLARLARSTRDTEQVMLANPDQALFMFSVDRPTFHPRMLDRFLVLAESRGLPAMIVMNKIDIHGESAADLPEELQKTMDVYARHYPVHFISVRTGTGIGDLRTALEGMVTVVAGPSGVGKSSLLNAIDPGHERLVGEISEATGKGRHTTTATVLYHIGPGTFVADTPGIRSLILQGVEPKELPGLFPEFRDYLGECYFPDCTHITEDGCRIRELVETGAIDRGRYDSYVALRRGDVTE